MQLGTRNERFRWTINMTPMIDVVLLVIIFFLYTARFAEVSRTSVQLPDEPGMGEAASDPQALLIDIAADGSMLLAGRPRSLERIVEVVREQADRLGGPQHLRVLLRADRNAPAGPVNDLARALTSLGVTRWSHATVNRSGRGS
ncbi:MAG: biopolymer transporter ExbD/TolR [Phycisphaerales bacterium]|nr:MAG: biopolymer transporter ExbD/TolR [Phycisphaerales bacterium]